MIIRASGLLPITSEPFSPGWLEIQKGRILQIQAGQPKTYDLDLEGYLIAPGFIDCHCHLDYTLFRNRIKPHSSFTEWLKEIIQLKTTFSLEDYRLSVLEGFKELIDYGTTSVLNVEAFPDLISSVSSPIRTWWAIEGIDIKSPFQFPNTAEAFSPHAPYTASSHLYQSAKNKTEKNKNLFTTHLNESHEEGEMFISRSGKLYDFFKKLGRNMSDCQGEDALTFLLKKELLPAKSLLVHMNYFSQNVLEKLKQLQATVVHCPETHAYFNRDPFPYQAFCEHNIPVVLGSDSLASASTLSLLSNLQQFHRTQPHLSYKTLLEMVTLNAAQAVQQQNKLGCLQPGAWADLIAVPFQFNQDPYEILVNFSKQIPFVMSSGKILRSYLS